MTGANLTPAVASTAPPTRVERSFDPVTLDRFIAAQTARHCIPGMALATTRGDQIVHIRGYGEAPDRVLVTGQTQFRIASLSKSFTALAVMQLVEGGHIALDAPISRYLPNFALANPLAAALITVHQLLHHTSGLADLGFVNRLDGWQLRLANRVAALRAAHPASAPGAAFHYFDPNYQLLARLVEVVSGQPFDVYLREHVLTPLAMRDTLSAMTSALPNRPTHQLAQGHIMAYGVPVALPELLGFLEGSGGVVSTAADPAHHLIAQNNHGMYAGRSVLSAMGVSRMQTPPMGVVSSYAMGWVVSNVHGTPTLEHNGVLSTFYADAVLLPESGYGFVLLYNANALTASTMAFAEMKNGVVALLMGRVPVSRMVTLPWLGVCLTAFSVMIVGLAIWNLMRLAQWKLRAVNASGWKFVWSALWPLTPALLLMELPRLLALQSGRYFAHMMLARAMPEVIILLAICAALGLVAPGIKIKAILCANEQTQRSSTPFNGVV